MGMVNEDERDYYLMPVIVVDEERVGSVQDGCGNWFIPNFKDGIWTGEHLTPFCGCYATHELVDVAIAFLEDLLLNDDDTKPRRPFEQQLADREAACGGYTAWMLMAYMADDFGWTEHGSSINGAWITDKGKQSLIGLKEMRREAAEQG